mgnify:CR=1 FL=1
MDSWLSALLSAVRTLLVAVVICSALELALPDHPMRNFVRLVLGLVIVACLVEPVTILVGSVETWSGAAGWALAPSEPARDSMGRAADGGTALGPDEIAAAGTINLLNSSLEFARAKAEGIVESIAGVSEARLEWERDHDGLPRGARLRLRAREALGPAAGEGVTGHRSIREHLEVRIKAVLSEATGLPPERIRVEFAPSG